MRSIAKRYIREGIRVNCICPGPVRTGLIEPEAWAVFPQGSFTPIETIASTVLQLIDGETMTDTKGNVVESGQVYGRAVEFYTENIYFRDAIEYCEQGMADLMAPPSGSRDKI